MHVQTGCNNAQENNYKTLRQIGKGAYGTAFIAQNTQTNERFVLKKVRLARQSFKERQASLQELHILSHLAHRNVLTYLESWIEAGCIVCLAVELCELQYRASRPEPSYFDELHLHEMMVQVASALAYLHSSNIVHRDVKSSNILITEAGCLKLADFGLATTLSHADQLCKTQVGTPNYMSPELVQDKEYGMKVDIFALGCVMYELSALKPAFKAFDLKGLGKKITSGPTPLVPSQYSDEWRSLVKSMLAKDEAKRPSAAEIMHMSFLQDAVARVNEHFGPIVPPGCSTSITVGDPPPSIQKLEEEFKKQSLDQEKRAQDDKQKWEGLRERYKPKTAKMKLDREKEKEQAAALARAKARMVSEPALDKGKLHRNMSGAERQSQRPLNSSRGCGRFSDVGDVSSSGDSFSHSTQLRLRSSVRMSDSNIPLPRPASRTAPRSEASSSSRSSVDCTTSSPDASHTPAASTPASLSYSKPPLVPGNKHPIGAVVPHPPPSRLRRSASSAVSRGVRAHTAASSSDDDSKSRLRSKPRGSLDGQSWPRRVAQASAANGTTPVPSAQSSVPCIGLGAGAGAGRAVPSKAAGSPRFHCPLMSESSDECGVALDPLTVSLRRLSEVAETVLTQHGKPITCTARRENS